MKKFTMILCLSLAIVCGVIFAGCEKTGGNSSSLSYNLEYNVNKLKNLLNKTEEADVSDLIIPEIYSESGNLSAQNESLPQKDLTNQIVSENEMSQSNRGFSPSQLEQNSKLNRFTNSSYAPRRASNVSFANSSYNSYLGKVEGLYVMVNDAVCANNEICSCKDNILAYCQYLALIAEQLKNKKIDVTKEQAESCNSLLKELSKATNKLTDTRSDVSNNCKNLSSKKSLSNGVDAISSRYVTLVNCLDNRLTNYQNVLAILMQLQCVLEGNCSGNLDNLGNIIGSNSTCPNGNCQDNSTCENGNCSSAIPTDKIADYANKNTERKTNIDTFKSNTFTPNIINRNFRNKENVQANQTSTNETNSQNFQNINQFPNQPQNTTQNNFGNITSPYQNGMYGNNIYGNGVYGNGMYGNGLYGVHNYENGTINPYRNTDTYKFPPQVSTGFGNGAYRGVGLEASGTTSNINLLQKPLPQERRQDFRGFNQIESNLTTKSLEKTDLKAEEELENKELNKLENVLEKDRLEEKDLLDKENISEEMPRDATKDRVFLETRTNTQDAISNEREIETKTISLYKETNVNPITEETLKTQEQNAS